MAIDALSPPLQAPRKQRRTLPAVWMRAGTSKGLFLHQRDLPPKREQWAPIILAVMGSQDADPRQLNGVAGATSTTSKVAVIKPSSRPDIDVEYTFVQVSIGSPTLDFTGNCGNIASGVGPFAVDEGLLQPRPGQKTVDVRILNTNTGRTIVETLDVDQEGHFLEDGEYQLAGTHSRGSAIGVSFEHPAGAMTGRLLPSGTPVDTLHIPGIGAQSSFNVNASLIDAANPFVLVDISTLPDSVRAMEPSSAHFLDCIEAIRCQGAVSMGLAKTVDAASRTRGTPKVALLSVPDVPVKSTESMPDVQVLAFSMGKVHSSLQLTGAVCLATAICTEGTIAHKISTMVDQWRIASGQTVWPRKQHLGVSQSDARRISIRHLSGTIQADVLIGRDGVQSVKLLRTARRLFEGNVCFVA